MMKVACVGILVADAIVETVSQYPEKGVMVPVNSISMCNGGNAMTASINLRRLGVESHILGMIGSDMFGSFLKENIWDILIEDLDKEILISSYGEKKKSKINEEQREKTIKQIALALICSCLCGDKIKITSSFLTTAEVLTETSRNTLKKYIEIFTAINSIKTFSHSKGIKKKIKSLDDYEENELKKGTANNIQKEILKQVSNTSCRTILEQNIKTLYNLMLKYKVLLNEQTTEFLFD